MRRLATTMWEFSWLVRRTGREAEYADWDRVLDELVERGYDCVRIDAFPHLIAAGPDGEYQERSTVLPQNEGFMWGNHEAVEVEPRGGLVEFISKCAERDLSVGLSSWFNDDSSHRAKSVITPEDFARIWLETLNVLREANLLQHVVWVDLCNEWPLQAWAPGAFPRMFGEAAQGFAPLDQPWDPDTADSVASYFGAIDELRGEYPGLQYTFSFCRGGSENLQQLDVSTFDLAEPHIWLTDDPEFNQRIGGKDGEALDQAGRARRTAEVFYEDRDRWIDSLDSNLETWKQWASKAGLPLYTTEGWGTVFYEDLPSGDGSEWDWLKDACAQAVRMAVEKGWTGICTSNFAQPHFEGMWADVEWHRELTAIIKKDG